MTRVNVNTASREELVEAAGLRPEVADEILKVRRKGGITGAEALGRLPGVGPATLEQLREALDFGAPAGNGGPGPEGAASRTAEARRAGAVFEAEREALGGAAEGASELGRLFLELVREQARQNLDAAAALGRAFDWAEAARVQAEFVRASLERANELNRRYLGVVQAMVAATTAAATTADERDRDRARRAA